MDSRLKCFLFMSPRVLCILFAVFLGLFALDVFGEEYGFWEGVLALLIHLLPVYIVVAVLIVAWRREWIGALLFFALGLFYLFETWGRFHWSTYLAISGPLVLIGILFLLNWIYRAQLRTG